jgi:hypothetical protein
MAYKYCQHVHENGAFCGSGAMRGRAYCYFHLRTRARRLAVAQANSQQKAWRPDLPPLENMHAVQVGLMQVLEGLASESVDRRRAALMLYALQQAATNLRAINPWLRSSAFELRPNKDGVVVDYPGLESEFGLPQRVDLDAPADELFPPPVQHQPAPAAIDSAPPGSVPRKPSKSVKQEKIASGEQRSRKA